MRTGSYTCFLTYTQMVKAWFLNRHSKHLAAMSHTKVGQSTHGSITRCDKYCVNVLSIICLIHLYYLFTLFPPTHSHITHPSNMDPSTNPPSIYPSSFALVTHLCTLILQPSSIYPSINYLPIHLLPSTSISLSSLCLTIRMPSSYPFIHTSISPSPLYLPVLMKSMYSF